jgi:CubicO group peptidase (beta-lactamase class C family)
VRSSHRIIFSFLFILLIVYGANGQANRKKGAQVDALFVDYDRPGVPGASVLVIQDGEVLLKKAYGLANVEEKIASTTGTNYRMASNTKQFTAMAIMMLAERGKLSYDSRLSDFFPGFPAYGKTITIRNMLNHTSGLLDYEDLIPPGTTTPLTDNDVLDYMKKQDHTHFPAGSTYRYSNGAFVLLGMIVEKVSGVSFPEFLHQNIFQPLGMKHTVFYQRDDHTDRARRSYGYSPQGDGFVRTDQSLTSSTRGDGTVYSSVDDLFKWDQALYKTRLVSAKTLNQAFTPGISVNETSGYGFGWFIEKKHGLRMIGHTGNTMGFSSVIQRFPEKKFTVIILTNRNDAPLMEIANKIEEIYLVNGKW